MICNDIEALSWTLEEDGYASLTSVPSTLRGRRDDPMSSNSPYDRRAANKSTSLLAAIADELRMICGGDEADLRLKARQILEEAFRSFEHTASDTNQLSARAVEAA